MAEGHGWFLRRYDGQRALQFLNFVGDLSSLRVVDVSAADLTGAARWLRRFADQPLTLTDALGLEWLERRSLRSCWSTDRHLGLTGVPLVIHAS